MNTSVTLDSISSFHDTAFRIQFEDANLVSSTVNSCDGTTLSIYNQQEGDSSLICGDLNTYESKHQGPTDTILETDLKFT